MCFLRSVVTPPTTPYTPGQPVNDEHLLRQEEQHAQSLETPRMTDDQHVKHIDESMIITYPRS